MEFENNLATFRTCAGLSQKRMAALLGITQSGLGKLEKSERRITLDFAFKVLRVLRAHNIKCTIDDVFPMKK